VFNGVKLILVCFLIPQLLYAIMHTAEIDSDYIPTVGWDPQDMQALSDDDAEESTENAEESEYPAERGSTSGSVGGLFD
jgi:hypothetical protein